MQILIVKLSKCYYFAKEIQYLDHLLSTTFQQQGKQMVSEACQLAISNSSGCQVPVTRQLTASHNW